MIKLPKIDPITGLLIAAGVLILGYMALRETDMGQQLLANSLLVNGEDVEDFKNAPNLDDRIREKLP